MLKDYRLCRNLGGSIYLLYRHVPLPTHRGRKEGFRKWRVVRIFEGKIKLNAACSVILKVYLIIVYVKFDHMRQLFDVRFCYISYICLK